MSIDLQCCTSDTTFKFQNSARIACCASAPLSVRLFHTSMRKMLIGILHIGKKNEKDEKPMCERATCAYSYERTVPDHPRFCL
eukprot:IDg15319t1